MLKYQTPYERWYQAKPSVNHLRIIWSEAFMHVPKAHRRHKKLSARAAGPFRLIGYSETKQLTYRLYDEEDGRIYESRDVTFNENNHISAPLSDSDTEDDVNDSGEYQVERILGKRTDNDGSVEYLVKWAGYDDTTWEPEDNVSNCKALDIYEEETTQLEANLTHTSSPTDLDEPTTYHEAINSPQSAQWRRAIDAELSSLKQNNTWTMVNNVPDGQYVVDSKWVFKIKRNPDGSIKKFKARLVARGFTQRPGIDFDETYSPVVKFTSLRIMLSIAAYYDMEIHQMDVITAFLNADIDTDIYMKVIIDGKIVIVKLNRSIYGLKQSPRLWNKTIDAYLRTLGFTPSNYDPAIYLRFDKSNNLESIISLYVDDLTIASRTMDQLNKIKGALATRFNMEDMGELTYLLGIEIKRNRSKRTISIGQQKYIDDIIKRFNLEHANNAATPIDHTIRLFNNELEAKVDQAKYQAIVGSLMYLVMGTRPDLAYPVSKLSQFLAQPRKTHMEQAIRTLRYVKATRDLRLEYGRKRSMDSPTTTTTHTTPKPLEIFGYSDADYAKDIETRRSTSGYVFMLYGGAISWKCQRQRSTALSTAEAEYMALAEAAKEATWLRNFVKSILHRNKQSLNGPTIIYEDNKSAIDIANNPVNHQRTKHIDIRYHFTREAIEDGRILLEHCPSEQMVADLLTKPFAKPRTITLTKLLGLGSGQSG